MHFFIMHFLKTPLFHYALLQNTEPNSPLMNPREKSNSLLMTIENNKGAMTHDGQKIETDVIIKTEEHDYF